MDLKKTLENYFESVKELKEFSPDELYRRIEPAFAESGFRSSDSPVGNILVIRLDMLGDMILTTGLFRELRKNYPDAYICAIVGSASAPVMEKCPYIDNMVTVNRDIFSHDFLKFFGEIANLAETFLWSRRYDMALLPMWGSYNQDAMLISYLSGAKRRIGFDSAVCELYIPKRSAEEYKQWERALLTDRLINPPEITHDAARIFWMLRELGITVSDESLELWLDENDIKSAGNFLKNFSGNFIVTLGIGSSELSRKYPIEKYAEAAGIIFRRYPAVKFVIIGGKSEVEDGDKITKRLPEGSALNLAGKTTLRESAAVISLSALYLGNDTGFMHAAAALKIPIIALYRESEDKEPICTGLLSEYTRFFPWQALSVTLRPERSAGNCAKTLTYGGCAEKFPHCIAQIAPEEIADAFDAITTEIKKVCRG